jgi:hypothetical protein
MCPIFGDHKEWFLVSIIFENHFGTWGIILDWIYFSTMPFVLFEIYSRDLFFSANTIQQVVDF